MPSFEKHGASTSTRPMESPAPVISLPESEGGLSTAASETQEEIKSGKSNCDEIKSEVTGKENVGHDSLAFFATL